EAENGSQLPLEVLDVIADAADAELAEVGQILADLRRVQVKLLGQRLRRDCLDPGGIERVQRAQVNRQAAGRQLRHLITRLAEIVLPWHKPGILAQKVAL